jgi:tripartite-type tricarboxylate transporter receptor subunit TctC
MTSPALPRRAAAALLGAAALVRPARAQTWPTRPVRIVIPYPPGGPSDFIARLIAEVFQAQTGQSLVADNRAGGNATIGTAAVAQASADGSVVLLATSQTHAINLSVMDSVPYRPIEDFTPIAGLVALPHILVVPADSPARDLAGLLAMLRAAPDRYNHGSTGYGTGGHLGGAMLMRVAGVSSTHVPFRGAAPMVTELLAGRLDYAIATLASVMPHIRSGALRPLGAASPNRLAQLPDLPTLAEQGVRGVELDAWYALFGPAGLPAEVVGTLARIAAATLDQPATVERLQGAGFVLWRRSPEELRAALPGEIARWGELVRTAGARVD